MPSEVEAATDGLLELTVMLVVLFAGAKGVRPIDDSLREFKWFQVNDLDMVLIGSCFA